MFGNITERFFAGRVESTHRRIGFFDYLIALDGSYRQRRKLASMSDAQLKDIGLTRKDVETELGSQFWDPPIQMR